MRTGGFRDDMKEYANHPLSDLFPIIPASELKDLIADLKERGLQSPIILYEGKILDGRHRYEACNQAGVKPKFETYKGDDPIGFVLAANLRRRHLNESQRALIAAKLATMAHGGDRKSEGFNQAANLPMDQEKAAETLNVSERSLRTAKAVLESPRLAKQVASGQLSVHAAHEQIKEKEKAKEPKPPRVDCFNRTIPTDVVPDWDRAHDIGVELQSLVSKVKCRVALGIKDGELAFREITNPTVSDAEGLHYTLSQILPHVVCPTCQGRGRKACMTCRQRGWISKYLYGAIDKAKKVLIEKGATK